MNRLNFAATFALLLAMATGMSAQGFQVYPGATKFTPPATEKALQAMPPNARETIYFTHDSFEKVVAFYKDLGKIHPPAFMKNGAKLPGGQPLQETFFIFDGSTTLTLSNRWAKIERPYVGAIDLKGATPEYGDIRDVTAIFFIAKKPAKWPEK